MIDDLFAAEMEPPESGIAIAMSDADVVYFPRLFNSAEADSLFEQLRQQVTWKQETITLYGQVHDLPRLTAWYGDPAKTYTYSAITAHPLEWIVPLLDIKHRIETVSGCSFNSVLLNRYRNGSDSVAWHADDEYELGKNPAIGSVSFGEARPFQMKHKFLDEKHKLLLEHGSCLMMQGTTQHYWLHQIPKSKRVLGERINLTFRKII